MDDVSRAPRAPIEVILVGAGTRAEAWDALLERSTAARVVARVARDPAAIAGHRDVPRFGALSDAMAAFSGARVAAALPPRASLEVAMALTAAGRAGVVEAPVHAAIARVALPEAARRVEVAHGWVTLPGRAWMERALAERAAERVTIDARGLPEEAGGDAEEVLAHALAIALRLFPEARVAGATQAREASIEVTLSAAGGPVIHVRARGEGRGIEVRAEGAAFEIGWSTDHERETISVRAGVGKRQDRSRAVQAAEVRALHQLVDPEKAQGDNLIQAREVARLAGDVARALGHRPALGARPLRDAARIARARPQDLLAQLGLIGNVPEAEPAPSFVVPTPEEPLELWPFRAGKKPVAFLTALPADADRFASYFEGAHVERRERRVHVGPQDAWIDQRDLGEVRVELYISRDPALVARAVRLQTEGDPSASLRELGSLMGYPPCCVEAFAAQVDRNNNTRNRYATAARTVTAGAWPWEINNLHTMLIPCYPCSYACAAARDLASSALDAMDAAHPGARRAIGELLARPALYFDHERQMQLHGEADGDTVRYRGVSVPRGTSRDFASFAGAIGLGDELVLTDESLVVRAAGKTLFTLRRTDPGLGFVAPFG
ncbi:MAG: hypothetical protein QM820_30005 [Minicystis sp.]